MRRLRSGLRRVAGILRAIVGAPDYESYVAHMRRAHPGELMLSAGEFFARRDRERFERPGGRCC